ncbi:hypothetical protein SAMN02745196_02117 [Clostridium collagenovorans DSM 3089]|uniref:Polymerase/histidinol phosphatase N-terminal domain-containing protein n=1 Tax=Clostridium collagenovorans DSM 3089 TaxID=1121306 RepID=A0A1M5XAN1_9CLOT|nr:CehA/McbA family metallohydrolase [Clostridium collagenovorans]SHH96263.1 hypothetical protein SAMN02745196_02117 [Clostridium collagenovorans DSM 3089]
MSKHKKKNKNESKSKKLKFYFGIPHSHTAYSSGKGTPYEAYKYARKKGLDYLVITDHCKPLRGKIKESECKKFNYDKNDTRWVATQNEADEKNKKDFLALSGYEISTDYFGHMNVYNCEEVVHGKYKSKNCILKWCEEHPESILCINHPSNKVTKLPYSDELNKYINFVEVGNGIEPYKYIRREKIYYELLDKGWEIGALNGQDNHKANWGDTENLTVVLMYKINKNDFIKALKNRNTYSTESKNLRLYFTINNNLMGSIINIKEDEKLEFYISIEDKKCDIIKIEIISNNSIIIKTITVNGKGFREKFFINQECSKNWYVVRVTQNSNKIAISSPIFVYRVN